MKIRFAFLLVMVGLIATVGSCTQRSLNALNPCTINGVVQNVPVNPQRALDLLIVIDDSQSMEQEQAKLALQVPRLVNLLLTGGEADPTAVGTFPAIESLHVGVITPDLGYSTVPTVPPHNFIAGTDFVPPTGANACDSSGKAASMQVTGYQGEPRVACDAQIPPDGTFYLNYETGDDPMDLVDDVTCITGQGTTGMWGCGFEQQLESIVASNGKSANAGFNRDGALLAVILITDEDDCSTTDPRVFDTEITSGNPFQGPLTPTEGLLKPNLRCWAHSDALQPVQRYVEEVAKLKSDPSQIVFAAITGIPEDSALERQNFASDAERYDAILLADAMQEVPDPAKDDDPRQLLLPACDATDGSGTAVPGRRIVETMRGLAEDNTGMGTVVESICADDYAPALNAIVNRIAAALRQLCLPRPLNRNSIDMVGCEVREVQPEGETCADAASRGREPEPVDTEDGDTEDGREVCRITQLPSDPAAGVPSGLGWFYDDFTQETLEACTFNPERQRVSFTDGAAPVAGARIRFECLQAAPPQDAEIGWLCTDDTQCVTVGCTVDSDPAACMTAALKERYDRENLELTCDGETNTCQLSCTSNVQCPGGFACYDASDDGNSYCVNPTCALN